MLIGTCNGLPEPCLRFFSPSFFPLQVVFLFHNAAAAIAAHDPTDPAAKKQLIDYARVTLQPGESTTVSFNVTLGKLSTVDRHGTRHVLGGGGHSLVFSRGHGTAASTAFCDVFLTRFAALSQLHPTPHPPWDMLYAVPMLIGCGFSACNVRYTFSGAEVVQPVVVDLGGVPRAVVSTMEGYTSETGVETGTPML